MIPRHLVIDTGPGKPTGFSQVFPWVWVRVWLSGPGQIPVPTHTCEIVTYNTVTMYSWVCTGTGMGLGLSYLSNAVPLLTVLRCYRYCALPGATVACRLPTDPNLNTPVAVAWETAMAVWQCGRVTTSTFCHHFN